MKNKEDIEEIVVVTMRCIDLGTAVYESDKVVCSECGEMTFISSSWRGKIISKIICKQCFDKNYHGTKFHASITEDCLNEAVDHVIKRFGYHMTREDIKKKMLDIVEEKLGKNIDVVE